MSNIIDKKLYMILKFFFCIVLVSAPFANGCVGIIWRSISFRS